MRGVVFHFDEDQDFGYIDGADGKRYIFVREDVRQEVSLARGTPVEFQPDDRTAHDIVAADSQTGDTSPSRYGRPRQPDPLSEHRSAASMELWACFRRALVDDYCNFNGRASRKEFWAFWLCHTLVLVALFGFGMLLDLAINGFDDGPVRLVIGFVLALIFAMAMIWPSTALIVRRLHDFGLTGWFALLCFTPALGGAAFLVLGLVPSQFGENRWGQAPKGVRV